VSNAIITDDGLVAWLQRIADYFNVTGNGVTLHLSDTPHFDDEWETVTLADLGEPTFPGYAPQPMAGAWSVGGGGQVVGMIPTPVQWIWFIDPAWPGEDDIWSSFIRDAAGNLFAVWPFDGRPVHISGSSGHIQVFPLFDARSHFVVP